MALRPLKMAEKETDEELPLGKQKRPELGRYLLQVDRQTKGSYATKEAADKAGNVIKKQFPILKVTVYDRVDSAESILTG